MKASMLFVVLMLAAMVVTTERPRRVVTPIVDRPVPAAQPQPQPKQEAKMIFGQMGSYAGYEFHGLCFSGWCIGYLTNGSFGGGGGSAF